MKRKHIRFAIPATILAIVLIIVIARAGDPLKFLKPDPAFRDYITAYTSGVISTTSTIKVRLAQPFADSLMIGKKADPSLLSFSPAVDGEVFWSDFRTLEFRSSSPMKQNTTYTCTFRLSLLRPVPESFQEFVFQFHTIRQNYEVQLNPPSTIEDQPGLYRVTGFVSTADQASLDDVKQVLDGWYLDSRVNLKWTTQQGSTRFNFTIDSLRRAKESTFLVIKHNGRPLGIKKQGEENLRLPGSDEFSVVGVAVFYDPDQHVLITFSDMLDPEMDLDGLVRLGSERNLRFSIDGNKLKVYTTYSRSGEITLVIEPSVKNIHGRTLGQLFSQLVDFDSMKPAVRMVGEGTILPATNGLLFPFETVNLKAVDVHIQKIYEKNVPQFLQVNELSGSSEMYRVAATVYNKRVDLTQTTNSVTDYSSWSRYALDLSKLIKPERGAIYRVSISFKKAYSTYPCGETKKDEVTLTTVDDTIEDTEDEWGYTGDYDDEWYGYDDYDWDERNNPCSNSYYYYKSASRNILSSDIGLIAKAGSDGDLICFATDIITANPLKGLDIMVMDFNMQVLAEGKTDSDGKITFSLKKKPFLVIARRGDERGYLKLGNANTLSLSLFDVDGQTIQRGIKGFLYAERGVWRPGDTMFINFILEDKLKNLPPDIPVMFELSDPMGNVVQRKVANSSVKGIYPFHVCTLESSTTGNYLGKVYIGNLTFTRYFKVETVKPNRLKIELKFPGEQIMAYALKPGILETRWLHGAFSPGLKADVSMTLISGKTQFKGFEGFNFDDPTTGFYSETSVVFEGNLDEAGKAAVSPVVEMDERLPGVLSASFVTKVFEPGGDFSINATTVPYYPFNSFAGLWVPKGTGWWDMLETGKQHQFKIANVTSSGKGVAKSKLRVDIYKIDWRWWWHNSERGLPYFLSNTEAVPVFTSNISVSGGRGQFNWGAAESEWGRYLIRVTDPASGHITGKVIYLDYSGWGRRPGQMRDGASMLSISTDKNKYNTGDKARITIPSSGGGRALVSVESGSKVLRTEWISTDSVATNFTLELTPEMSPNVYVHVMLLQPHRQTANDMPIRMYGVVPVLVEDPGTILQPVISMPSSWESESEATITVSEAKGKPMAYTLYVVDEGLLDLTGFKTPDPWKNFYGKEALGVRTWDLFSEVIGAFTAGFDRLLSIGGGDTRIHQDKQKTRRFTPVVKSFGPVYLEPGKRSSHTFNMPQYVGSVRVMVVAAHEGAYGNAEKTAAVKSPLMVLGTLPRVAGPGETINLPVSVFAMEKEIRNVQVSITPSGLFEASGYTSQNITFKNTGDQIVNFRLKVKEQVGSATVDIFVKGGTKTARHTISLEVRNPNPPEVRLYQKTIKPGESWSDDLVMHGITGTNQVEIELSSMPPLNLAKRLDYLIRYPHGCLEQTVSAAFPQLMLKNLVYLDQRSSREIDNNIKAAITKLNQHLMSEGTFSYWPNGRYLNEWTNSYAGHFLVEAESKGFSLPAGLKKRWISSQRQLANSWQHSEIYFRDDLVQAYRLYTLALAGSPEMGAMNRLRSSQKLSAQARWRLAATYALAGKLKTAQNLVENASAEIPPYNEYGNTFGEPVRDRAMVLETCLLLKNMQLADEITKTLVTSLNNNQWYSTQTTAYTLISVSRYFNQVKTVKGLNCTYQFNGKNIAVKTDKSMFTENLNNIGNAQSRKVIVKNNSEGTLYVNLRVTGIPMPGQEIQSARKLKMAIEYMYPDGSRLDPASISQGKDFMARITVTSLSADPIQEIALTHIIPSGWQIHNARLTGIVDTRTGNDNNFNHQDIRDDRILTYFNLEPLKSKTFNVMLNATYTGKYYMPSIRCEAMYAADTYSQITGKWIEVVR